jgi:hypothetical protein
MPFSKLANPTSPTALLFLCFFFFAGRGSALAAARTRTALGRPGPLRLWVGGRGCVAVLAGGFTR